MKFIYTMLGLAIGVMWIVFIYQRLIVPSNGEKERQRSATVVSVVRSSTRHQPSGTDSAFHDQAHSHGLLDSWLVWLFVFVGTDAAIGMRAKKRIKSICRNPSLSTEAKLAEIENQDILFDLPLYVGLFGTVLGFILISRGWSSSRDAAYISTVVGIVASAALRLSVLRPAKSGLCERMKPEPEKHRDTGA